MMLRRTVQRHKALESQGVVQRESRWEDPGPGLLAKLPIQKPAWAPCSPRPAPPRPQVLCITQSWPGRSVSCGSSWPRSETPRTHLLAPGRPPDSGELSSSRARRGQNLDQGNGGTEAESPSPREHGKAGASRHRLFGSAGKRTCRQAWAGQSSRACFGPGSNENCRAPQPQPRLLQGAPRRAGNDVPRRGSSAFKGKPTWKEESDARGN